MAENPTDLIAEFQKLRHETSGISRNLMARTRSVDARRNSSSSSNNEVLKVMNENHDEIRKEIEAAQKKQSEDLKVQLNAQNRMMKEVLDELRFARREIGEIKKQQKEDSETLEAIDSKAWQIRDHFQDGTILKLRGIWQKTHSTSCGLQWLTANQQFVDDGNMLDWSYLKKRSYYQVANVEIGSDECKITEDGKIVIKDQNGQTFDFEMYDKKLTIYHGRATIQYKKC